MLSPIDVLKIGKKVGQTLSDFEKSETLQTIDNAVEKGNQWLDNVQEQYKREPITLEQYLENISPTIDEQIKNYCQKQPVQSLGGELIFKEDTDDKIHIQCDCYYKNATGKIIKISSEKRLDKAIFTTESLEKILKTSPIYPIEPPQE